MDPFPGSRRGGQGHYTPRRSTPDVWSKDGGVFCDPYESPPTYSRRVGPSTTHRQAWSRSDVDLGDSSGPRWIRAQLEHPPNTPTTRNSTLSDRRLTHPSTEGVRPEGGTRGGTWSLKSFHWRGMSQSSGRPGHTPWVTGVQGTDESLPPPLRTPTPHPYRCRSRRDRPGPGSGSVFDRLRLESLCRRDESRRWGG